MPRWRRSARVTPTGPAGWRRRRSGCRRPDPTSWRGSTRSTRRCAQGGFVKEALRLRRTALESVDDDGKRIAALRVLATEAKDAGLPGLAASWRFDAGEVPLPPVAASPCPSRPPSTTWRRSGCWRAGRMIRRACWRCWRRRSRDTRAPMRRWRWPRSWSRAWRPARNRRAAGWRCCARRTPTSTSPRAGRAWAGASPPSWRPSVT